MFCCVFADVLFVFVLFLFFFSFNILVWSFLSLSPVHSSSSTWCVHRNDDERNSVSYIFSSMPICHWIIIIYFLWKLQKRMTSIQAMSLVFGGLLITFISLIIDACVAIDAHTLMLYVCLFGCCALTLMCFCELRCLNSFLINNLVPDSLDNQYFPLISHCLNVQCATNWWKTVTNYSYLMTF